MALNTLKCNRLTPLGFKVLTHIPAKLHQFLFNYCWTHQHTPLDVHLYVIFYNFCELVPRFYEDTVCVFGTCCQIQVSAEHSFRSWTTAVQSSRRLIFCLTTPWDKVCNGCELLCVWFFTAWYQRAVQGQKLHLSPPVPANFISIHIHPRPM